MAVSATPQPAGLDPRRIARWVRRGTLIFAVVVVTWFMLQFSTRWVPLGMNTVPSIPEGSWLVCDRWASGLRVGSDVFVMTSFGEMLTRVTELTDTEVHVRHPNDDCGWPDSDEIGALPRDAVLSVVVVVFAPESRKTERQEPESQKSDERGN